MQTYNNPKLDKYFHRLEVRKEMREALFDALALLFVGSSFVAVIVTYVLKITK